MIASGKEGPSGPQTLPSSPSPALRILLPKNLQVYFPSSPPSFWFWFSARGPGPSHHGTFQNHSHQPPSPTHSIRTPGGLCPQVPLVVLTGGSLLPPQGSQPLLDSGISWRAIGWGPGVYVYQQPGAPACPRAWHPGSGCSSCPLSLPHSSQYPPAISPILSPSSLNLEMGPYCI